MSESASGSLVSRASLLWLASEGTEARTLSSAPRLAETRVHTTRSPVRSGPCAGVPRFLSFCSSPSVLLSSASQIDLASRTPLPGLREFVFWLEALLPKFTATYAWGCLPRVRALGPLQHSEVICQRVSKSGSNHLTQARPRLLVSYVLYRTLGQCGPRNHQLLTARMVTASQHSSRRTIWRMRAHLTYIA